MGKRQRRRTKTEGSVPAGTTTTDYTDAEGNVLTLRDSLAAGSRRKLSELPGSAAATADDIWRRRTELAFERLVVRWSIAGLPLEGQAELLARYRIADVATQDWVRATITEHLRRLGNDLG